MLNGLFSYIYTHILGEGVAPPAILNIQAPLEVDQSPVEVAQAPAISAPIAIEHNESAQQVKPPAPWQPKAAVVKPVKKPSKKPAQKRPKLRIHQAFTEDELTDGFTLVTGKRSRLQSVIDELEEVRQTSPEIPDVSIGSPTGSISYQGSQSSSVSSNSSAATSMSISPCHTPPYQFTPQLPSIQELTVQFDQLRIKHNPALHSSGAVIYLNRLGKALPNLTMPINEVTWQLLNLLEQNQAIARVYGGHVRDHLLIVPSQDIDIITDMAAVKLLPLLPAPWSRDPYKSNRFNNPALSMQITCAPCFNPDATIAGFLANKEGQIFDPNHAYRDLGDRYLVVNGDLARRLLDDEKSADPVSTPERFIYMRNRLGKMIDTRDLAVIQHYGPMVTDKPHSVYSKNLQRWFLCGHAWQIFNFMRKKQLIDVFFPFLQSLTVNEGAFHYFCDHWYKPQLKLLDALAPEQRKNAYQHSSSLIALLLLPLIMQRAFKRTKHEAIDHYCSVFAKAINPQDLPMLRITLNNWLDEYANQYAKMHPSTPSASSDKLSAKAFIKNYR